MAVEARKAGHHEEADRQLKQAAELGDPRAMYEWGCILLDGSAATQQNVTEAVAWLNKASAAGMRAADVRLGSCADQGIGMQKDPQKALTWYRQAADAGEARAQVMMGLA